MPEPATLTLAAFLAMAPACGRSVDAGTLSAVVGTESAFHPFAVATNENGRTASSRRFPTAEAATAYVETLLARGVTNIDMGAAQLNWRAGHLQKRSLPPGAAFDPCTAARIGSEVLSDCYQRAPSQEVQRRLDDALNCYNSGRFGRNGYETRVRVTYDRQIVPALRARDGAPVPVAAPTPSPEPAPIGPCGPPPASWDGWALAAHERCVTRARTTPTRIASTENRE